PWRRREGRLEVFWVRRSEAVPFMPGWHAFPGGGVGRGDADLPVRGEPRPFAGADAGAPPPRSHSPIPAGSRLEGEEVGPDLAPGVAAAALRELWEETGLLLVAPAGDPQDAHAPNDATVSAAAPTLPRDAGTPALTTALREHGLALD